MVVQIPEMDFGWIVPEIAMTVFAAVALLLTLFRKKNSTWLFVEAMPLVGAIVALYFTFQTWNGNIDIFNNLYTIDNFGVFFKGLSLVILILVTLLSYRYIDREDMARGEYYSLLMFGTLGMMIMVSSNNFITIFIGLEVMSISIYILAGLMGGNAKSVEASLKYFLLGAFATAFLLYGIALIYGTTGMLDIREIAGYVNSGNFMVTPTFMAGLALLIVGFGFKTASVPFHMWTPDVYEGAPTSITAYMATGVKAAAFAAFLRVLFTAFHPFLSGWTYMLWILAVATMTLGNITALKQDDVKRMLAYSSIAHAGYILIALTVGDRTLSSTVLYYLLVYSFMTIGAFAVVIILGRQGSPNTGIESYAGLAGRHPVIAAVMAVFLFSMAGIPPLAGFMGKFYVLTDAIRGGYYWLAIIGVLNSVVAAYYYLRVVMYMYFKEPEAEIGAPDVSIGSTLAIAISVVVVFYLGIFPRLFLMIAHTSSAIFM
jgi:NADH-quinone oxidoreductase subunit N